MTQDHGSDNVSQDMGMRFDLLATDVKKYALFLVELGGNLLCWNPGAKRFFGYELHSLRMHAGRINTCPFGIIRNTVIMARPLLDLP